MTVIRKPVDCNHSANSMSDSGRSRQKVQEQTVGTQHAASESGMVLGKRHSSGGMVGE